MRALTYVRVNFAVRCFAASAVPDVREDVEPRYATAAPAYMYALLLPSFPLFV